MPAPSAFLFPSQSAGWPTVLKTRKVDGDGFHFVISRYSVTSLHELSASFIEARTQICSFQIPQSISGTRMMQTNITDTKNILGKRDLKMDF